MNSKVIFFTISLMSQASFAMSNISERNEIGTTNATGRNSGIGTGRENGRPSESDIYTTFDADTADTSTTKDDDTNDTDDSLTDRITKAFGGVEAYEKMNKAMDGGLISTEFDLILTQEQFEYFHGNRSRTRRKAVRNPTNKWPNAVMSYEFSRDFSSSQVSAMKRAMDEIAASTCITFRPSTNQDRASVRFQNGRGCSSLLGMVRKRQPITLGSGCRTRSIYIHEVGHALGLIHEHQRGDRDRYIEILSNNVQRGLMSQFNKFPASQTDLSVPYDLSSIMHYNQNAFSVGRNLITIRAKDSSKQRILRGRNTDLTFSDIKILNVMYNCQDRCKKTVNCREPAFVDKNCNCIGPNGIITGGGNGGKDGNGGGTGGATRTSSTSTTTTTTTTTSKTTTTTSGGGGNCRDLDTRCEQFAQIGLCRINIVRSIISKYCSKTCGVC